MKFYDTDSSNVEYIKTKFEGLFAANVPFRIVSVDKMPEIIKCKKTSGEAEYLSKKDPCVLIQVFEDAFNLLDDQSKEFVVLKGLQGVSYNFEKGTININNDLVHNICELRQKDMYKSKAKDFLDMLETEKAAIEQVLEQRKAEKQLKGKPQA